MEPEVGPQQVLPRAWGMGVKSPWPFPFVDCDSLGCSRVKILTHPTGTVIMARFGDKGAVQRGGWLGRIEPTSGREGPRYSPSPPSSFTS